MIRTYTLDCHAANPQMPLEPVCPYTGSAATFVLINLPRPHGKQKIDAVTLSVTNADAAVSAHQATREGSSWIVTVPAAAIGPAGNIKEAIIISASGVDEQNRPVPSWIIAVADLRVRHQDGTAVPGEPRVLISWFDSRPANPRGVFICPSPDGQAALDLFDGHNYRPLVGGGTDVSGKLPMRPLPKYLNFLAFDDTYQADAQAFYDSIGGARVIGGCSIVRKGGLVGGNFDYPYDDACTFAIKVSAAKGANADGRDRHASVGAAYLGTRLTENIVSSGVSTPLYRVLPGMTESGINDAGVYAKINVIPRDPTKDPEQSETRNINALAVVRYVLDHFDNAADAATYIAAHYYIPEGSADSYHWMIADATGTWVVEDGEYGEDVSSFKLTNHRVFESDEYGSGYSRDTILSGSGTVAELLAAVKFTNAYATGWPWPDEFAGQEDAQGKIPHDATERLKAWADAHVAPLLDENRKPAARGNGCWQTVHSCIYDFEKKTMAICVQEDFSKRYVFAVDQANVDLSPIEAQIAELQDGKRDKTDLAVYKEVGDGDWVATSAPEPFTLVGKAEWTDNDGGLWIWTGTAEGGAVELGFWTVGATEDSYDAEFYGDGNVSSPFHFHATRPTKADPVTPPDSLVKKSELLASGILKGDGLGGVTAATPSSHDAPGDFRAPTDNECHKTEFTEWVTDYPDGGIVWVSDHWETSDGVLYGFTPGTSELAPFDAAEIDLGNPAEYTATRAKVCTDGEKFMTPSRVFGNDGKPSDAFATDLFGKSVAITAIDARIKTNAESAAEPTNAVTLNDNAPKTVTVDTATADSLAVTFGTARNGGLRICELYILNGTADTDLTFDSAVHFVATGDSFPACEAGINYFVFAEVAANLWKVTRETLKTITTPTPVAAA